MKETARERREEREKLATTNIYFADGDRERVVQALKEAYKTKLDVSVVITAFGLEEFSEFSLIEVVKRFCIAAYFGGNFHQFLQIMKNIVPWHHLVHATIQYTEKKDCIKFKLTFLGECAKTGEGFEDLFLLRQEIEKLRKITLGMSRPKVIQILNDWIIEWEQKIGSTQKTDGESQSQVPEIFCEIFQKSDYLKATYLRGVFDYVKFDEAFVGEFWRSELCREFQWLLEEEAFEERKEGFVSEEVKLQKKEREIESLTELTEEVWFQDLQQKFGKKKGLDENTWDRLYQAWLRAYKTKRIIQETVTVDNLFKVLDEIISNISKKGLRDIIVKKKFQKQINANRIPFLDRIFRVPINVEPIDFDAQQIIFEFDGGNADFIKSTQVVLQSLDEISYLSDRVEGLTREQRENSVRGWALQQQEDSSLPFHQAIQNLSMELQINDRDFLWEEITKDLITLIEDLTGIKRFVYLSEEEDKAAGELLDSLLSGARSVSSLSYDEVMTFSQLTSAVEQAREDGDERIIEEETYGVKQFLGVTECSEELEDLLVGVWLSGVGDRFHKWKRENLKKQGSSNPEEDYQVWCRDTDVWDYKKGNFCLDDSEMERELGSEVFSRKAYEILLDVNSGYNSQDSLNFSKVISMFNIVLFALCRVGVDAKATTVFSSIGVTPDVSFYHELLDMAKTVYKNKGRRDILETVIRSWKIRRLVRGGSMNPEKAYLKWVGNKNFTKIAETKQLASDLLLRVCSDEREENSLSYEEVVSLFRKVYKAADKVGFNEDYDGMRKLMGISDDSSGFFCDMFAMAEESMTIDEGGDSLEDLIREWKCAFVTLAGYRAWRRQ